MLFINNNANCLVTLSYFLLTFDQISLVYQYHRRFLPNQTLIHSTKPLILPIIGSLGLIGPMVRLYRTTYYLITHVFMPQVWITFTYWFASGHDKWFIFLT